MTTTLYVDGQLIPKVSFEFQSPRMVYQIRTLSKDRYRLIGPQGFYLQVAPDAEAAVTLRNSLSDFSRHSVFIEVEGDVLYLPDLAYVKAPDDSLIFFADTEANATWTKGALAWARK